MPRRLNDMDSCRVPILHAHTTAETRDVDFFATRRGIIDLALFKRVHCSPAAREKFRRDWGVDPIWTDMEDFFEQMYWLRRFRINTRFLATTADVREPNILDLHATIRALNGAIPRTGGIIASKVYRPDNTRPNYGTTFFDGWDVTLRLTQHKLGGVLGLPAKKATRADSDALGTWTVNSDRARARTTASASDATLLAVRGSRETFGSEVELGVWDRSRPDSDGDYALEQR